LATVVIGGLITATFLTLIILPIFYIVFSSHSLKKIFKMKAARTTLIVILALLCPSFFNSAKAQSAKKIDLKQAVQMALDSNLAVHSSVYLVEAQKALKGAAWDIPKTSVDGQYGQFNSYSKDNGFTISQSFAFPTLYLNQNKLANANIKSSEWQLKATQLEIATQVKQVYWQLAYLQSKQKLLIYQDSLYSGFQRAAELRAKTGETNRLEMISVRSQSLEVKNQLQQVNADLDIFNQKLQTLLNADSYIYPADTVLTRIYYSQMKDISALTANPSTGYMQQQVEVAWLEKKVEFSKMMPDFSIGYLNQSIQGVQDVNGIPQTFGAGDRFSAVQAGVTIPLWFVPITSKTKAAKIKYLVAQTNAEYFTKSLSGNYKALLGEYSKYSTSLDFYEKQAVPEAGLIIDQATRSYKAGAMDYLDYILNLNRALGIKQNYLDALNNYNQIIIAIESITGKIF
jgi:cobalt-zinc-cadmium resistance protein CzcA